YDFVQLPPPGVAWPPDVQAYLAVFRERAIGLAIVGTAPRWGYYARTDAEGYIQFDQRSPCTTIAGVFTCGNYRGHGIATRLIHAVSAREGIPVTDLAWGVPFSEGGCALALSMVPTDALRVTR